MSRPRRWSSALTVTGAVLVLVCLVLGAAPVATEQGSCGTGFAPSAPDDMVIGPACDDAQGRRRVLMAAAGVPGLLLLGVAGAGAVVRRRR